MVYVNTNDFVNICILGNSWKGLANQLSENGVMSSCMTHNWKTLGKHTNVMQKLFVNIGSFSFSLKTQSIELQNVHFGTCSLFFYVGSMFSHKILSWKILYKDIKVNVHLELHACWKKQTLCWLLILLHRFDLPTFPLNLEENLLDHQDWIKKSSTCMRHGGTLTSAWWRMRWICIS
jgi:hypothetical protein